MLMKVFNKGQVVIPAEIRRLLGIEIGDRLDVEINHARDSIKLHKATELDSEVLAGSLAAYAREKPFPTRKEMQEALREGLRHG